jgi:tetratricopeptide (TPR) repeat protein
LPYKGAGKSAKEIGRELAVGTLLEGSVRKTADEIQITLQLVDAESQEDLWTGNYAADAGNLPAVPREIARRVAESLRVELEASERRQLLTAGTSNADAYKLYLKGRHFLDKADQASAKQAREYFQQALDLDPTFAQGWTGLGDAYAALGLLSPVPAADAYPRTRAAAERALRIDPDLPEAHLSLGTALSYYYWEFEAAAHHYRRAIELNPSYAEAHRLYAEYLRYRGRFDEALGEARQAEELDPLSPGSQLETGVILYLARRYDEAIARFRRLLDMNPRFTFVYFFLALVHVQKHEYEKALATLDQMVAAAGGPLPDVETLRAQIHAMTGRRAAARRQLETLDALSREQHVSPWHPAMIHLSLGEHDRALDLLEQAHRDRDWRVRLLPVEPLFDPLRANPRFAALVAKVR